MMTALLAVSLAVIAALTTALIFIVTALSKSQGSLRSANAGLLAGRVQIGQLEIALNEFKNSTSRLGESLQEKIEEVEREKKARRVAEDYRDMLLAEFAKSADPLAVSARISSSLRSLSQLSSAATTTAPGGGDQAKAVHGSAAKTPVGGVADKAKP